MSGGARLSLLSSLQVEDREDEEFEVDREAARFLEDFVGTKLELTSVLFDLYNSEVFDGGMPTTLRLLWSGRLSSTAGYFSSNKQAIVLSDKIVHSPLILLTTLIHEMCHAAVRYIDKRTGVPAHGALWRKWTVKARNVFPEIPKVTVTHRFKRLDQLDPSNETTALPSDEGGRRVGGVSESQESVSNSHPATS